MDITNSICSTSRFWHLWMSTCIRAKKQCSRPFTCCGWVLKKEKTKKKNFCFYYSILLFFNAILLLLISLCSSTNWADWRHHSLCKRRQSCCITLRCERCHRSTIVCYLVSRTTANFPRKSTSLENRNCTSRAQWRHCRWERQSFESKKNGKMIDKNKLLSFSPVYFRFISVLLWRQIGSLIIPAIKKKDSGNYTCYPSNSPNVTIVLHVINGKCYRFFDSHHMCASFSLLICN